MIKIGSYHVCFCENVNPLKNLEGAANGTYQAIYDGICQYISKAKLKEMFVYGCRWS